jgi:type IV secretion system protein VirB10
MTDQSTPAEPAPPPKVDPETLVLRGSPRRVVRFRRGVIIAAAALGSTAIVGVTWFALKPATFHIVAEGENRSDAGAKRPPDELANAPRTYGDVPQLGPPLPGDLGRPILDHQRQIGALSAGEPGADAAGRAAQAAEAERQRIAAERKAARESTVLAQISGASLGTPTSAARMSEQTEDAVVANAIPESPASHVAFDPARDPNGQQRKLDFLGSRDTSGDVNPHGVQPPVSPWMLSAGSVISASLITGLNSDLPGLVTAQVTENAYDSATGRILLIPQGARLIGSYDSVIAFGQKRALVVWQRVIFPDGASIRIDNVPASDPAGYAGLADKVDFHTWRLLKGVALATLLGVGTELSFGSNESDLVRAIRESTQQNADRAGQQITMKNLDVQPTITVRPGSPLRVIVHKDLILRPWRA